MGHIRHTWQTCRAAHNQQLPMLTSMLCDELASMLQEVSHTKRPPLQKATTSKSGSTTQICTMLCLVTQDHLWGVCMWG